MTSRDFVYWLNGYLEMSDAKKLTPKQLEMVKKHLALVLTNVTDNIDFFKTGSIPAPAPIDLSPTTPIPSHPQIGTPDWLPGWSTPAIIC